jgi:hypothetical protein
MQLPRRRVLATLLVAGAVTATAATAAVLRSGDTRTRPAIRIESVEPLRIQGGLHDLFDRVYRVRVRISGWRMYPLLGAGALPRHNRSDGGHWHLYVDGEYASASNDHIAHTWYLDPGSHAVRAQLTNVDHTPLEGPSNWSQAVTITVP